MLMKDECKKEIGRENFQTSIRKLQINRDQTSIELKNEQEEALALKKEEKD